MRSIHLAMSLAILLAASALATAQLKPPSVVFNDGGKPGSLDLAKVQVRTVIKGYVAETTEIMTFHNSLPRVLQGDLDFPLPDGATVSGFALDVEGVLVDGVPVPKEKARITFEKETRKGVDPGLAEQTVGNSFRTRIYPIPANGDRIVKVQYVADLSDVVIGDGAISYRLPLRWGKAIGECSVHIEVLDSPSEPQIRGAMSMTAQRQPDRWVAEQTVHGVDFASDLVVALPQPPAQSAVVEKRTSRIPGVDALENHLADPDAAWLLDKPEYYFAIHDQAPAAPSNAAQARKVRRIGLCWDASLNRSTSDKSRELDLLQKLIKQLDVQQVDLIVFSNTAAPPKTFAIAGGDSSPLIDAINAVTYDGGLCMSALNLAGDDELYLLFSSGLVNIGKSMPAKMAVPIYPITNEALADYALLRRIAAETGGTFFNLLKSSDEQALTSMSGTASWSLLSIDIADGQVADVYPKGRQPVTGRICIAGRLLSEQATLVLHYGFGAGPQQSVTYVLKQSDASATGIVPRLWAQMKLAELSIDEQANAAAIAEIGQQFNLVTSNTSLLVLETLQQYLTYQIVPPRTRPEVYNQFVGQIAQQAKANQQTREQRIAQALDLWRQRADWWDQEYKYEKNFKFTEPQGGGGLVAGDVASDTGGRATAARREAAATPANQRNAARLADRPALAPSPAETAVRVEELTVPLPNQVIANLHYDAAQKDITDGPAIAIKPWDPSTPYLAAMKSARIDQAYGIYLDQRKSFAASPAFYLDCADFLLNHDQRDLGVRILTDIPALKLESPELLRIAGYRLCQIGLHDLAVDLFEKALAMRPEEPQSYRDLALALADRAAATSANASQSADMDRAAADYSRALDLLWKLLLRQPDQRFPGIDVIALEEANCILAQADRLSKSHPIANPIDSRFFKLMDLDVRVVMSWDTADTDIDLWVTEPSGEKCVYNHNRTVIGGMLSSDMTQGYGPEEYNLRRAMPGKYVIQANFFGSRTQAITGPTTVHAMVITHWGRPDERRQSLTVRLTDNKEVVDLGTVTIEP